MRKSSVILLAALAALAGQARAADYPGDMVVGANGEPGTLTVHAPDNSETSFVVRNHPLDQRRFAVEPDGLTRIYANKPNWDVNPPFVLNPNDPSLLVRDWRDTGSRVLLTLQAPNTGLLLRGTATDASAWIDFLESDIAGMRIRYNGGAGAGGGQLLIGDYGNGTGTPALVVNRSGNVGIGIGGADPVAKFQVGGSAALGGSGLSAAAAQVVLGKNNDTRTNDNGINHTQGLFIVGSGAGTGARQNAMRVLDDGVVLVKPSGCILMGEYNKGPTP